MSKDFEVSSQHLTGLVNAVREAGLLHKVSAALGPAAQSAVANTYRSGWFPGAVVEEVWIQVVKLGGPQQLSDVNYTMSKKTFGPVVQPLIKIAISLTDAGPSGVAGALPNVLRFALRDVKATWTRVGDQSGEYLIEYPRPMSPVTEHAWRGVFRFTAELARPVARVTGFQQRSEGAAFWFQLGW